jgi:hypothetical protein
MRLPALIFDAGGTYINFFGLSTVDTPTSVASIEEGRHVPVIAFSLDVGSFRVRFLLKDRLISPIKLLNILAAWAGSLISKGDGTV